MLAVQMGEAIHRTSRIQHKKEAKGNDNKESIGYSLIPKVNWNQRWHNDKTKRQKNFIIPDEKNKKNWPTHNVFWINAAKKSRSSGL